MLRPERLQIAVGPGPTGAASRASFATLIFQGASARLQLELGDGTEVVTYVDPDDDLPFLRPGASVTPLEPRRRLRPRRLAAPAGRQRLRRRPDRSNTVTQGRTAMTPNRLATDRRPAAHQAPAARRAGLLGAAGLSLPAMLSSGALAARVAVAASRSCAAAAAPASGRRRRAVLRQLAGLHRPDRGRSRRHRRPLRRGDRAST